MKNALRKIIGGIIATVLGTAGVVVPAAAPANAAITTSFTGYGMHEIARYVGHYKASTDGFSGGNPYGNTTANGVGSVGALVPSPGATVVKAFLTSEGYGWDGSQIAEVPRPPVVTLAGQSVSFYAKNHALPWTNFLADVTSIVQGYLGGSPTGTAVTTPWSGTKYSLPLVYEASQNPWGMPTYSDGLALTVIFEDNSMTSDSTVVYYFGTSNSAGQIMALNFDTLPALPNNGTYSGSWLSLGSGWSQGGGQYSTIKAQNNLQAAQVGTPWTDISGSAGGCDDSRVANGTSTTTGCDSQWGLISVGGIGDSTSNPSAIAQGQADDELYNLDQLLAAGVNRIDLSTRNPSGDDNLFQLVLSLPFVLHGTVSFRANGGTGSMTDQVSLTSATLTDNAFVRAGWSFIGWNTAADGSGTSYVNQATYDFQTDTILYAQWSQNTREVTFDTQGGSTLRGAFYTGTITAFPTAPTWAGHAFNGWFLTASGGTAITAPYTPASFTNITLYAQWTTLTQPVTFDTQGGSPIASTTYLGTLNALPATPTRAGFTFAGWYSAATGGAAIATPYTPSTFAAITIYAQWLPVVIPMIHHTASFDSQGGAAVADLDFFYNFDLPAAPVRSGYAFKGWFLQPSGGQPIAGNYAPRPLGDQKLFAQWQKAEYTASFDTQGGTAIAPTGFTEAVPLPAAPTRHGYRFLGWFDSPTGGSGLGAAYVPAQLGDVTLYAQWAKVGALVLWGFADGSAKPTSKMLAQLKSYLTANPSFRVLACTGATEGPTLLAGDRKLALKRAGAVCAAAKALMGNANISAKLATESFLATSPTNRRVVIRFSE